MLDQHDSASTRQPQLDHQEWVPFLDGIRAVACLLVLFGHFVDPYSQLKFFRIFHNNHVANYGVVLFFVLSGFLLVSRLANEYIRTGNILIKRYLIRRMLRIWPLYFTYLAIETFLYIYQPLILFRDDTPNAMAERIEYIKIIVVYCSFFMFNWVKAFPWLYVIKPGTSAFILLWSLSVEEQYYWCLPFVSLFLFRLPGKRALAWLAGLILMGMVSRVAFLQTDILDGQNAGMYFSTFTYLDIFLVSGWFGWMVANGWHLKKNFMTEWGSKPMVLPLLLVIIITSMHFWKVHPPSNGWTVLCYTVFAFTSSSLLFWTLCNQKSWFAQFLSSSPMRTLGILSYGIYLWHITIPVYIDPLVLKIIPPRLVKGVSPLPSILSLSIYLGLTLLLASLTYGFVERPFLNLRTRILSSPPPETNWQAAAMIGMLITVVAGVGVLWLAWSHGRILPFLGSSG